METTEQVVFAGHTATVIRPERPNGKWIWKTEFLYAFDQAERALVEEGYTRVYYSISNMYGNDEAVRLMHAFHKYVVKAYDLCQTAILFGFSRGALYAVRYALFYPEWVSKLYLDAPVLDFRTWPPVGDGCHPGLLASYGTDDACLATCPENPILHLGELFDLHVPLCVVAGDADSVVPFEKNAGVLLAYAKEHGFDVNFEVKPGCDHHPHSLEDPKRIVDFVNA